MRGPAQVGRDFGQVGVHERGLFETSNGFVELARSTTYRAQPGEYLRAVAVNFERLPVEPLGLGQLAVILTGLGSGQQLVDRMHVGLRGHPAAATYRGARPSIGKPIIAPWPLPSGAGRL